VNVDAGNRLQNSLSLPLHPSEGIIEFLFSLCESLERIGGHTVDEVIRKMLTSSALMYVSFDVCLKPFLSLAYCQ
jgi:hypothetical protein